LVNQAISIFITLAPELPITYRYVQSDNIPSGALATFSDVSVEVAKTYFIMLPLVFDVTYNTPLSTTHC